MVLAELDQLDTSRRYRRELYFHARFGDPRARARALRLRACPTARGLTFSVLQGFHGAFSHRGSNEYAVDFDCPVATPVLAARPGVVVAANAAAQGAGTTPEFLDYKRTNFVLVLHDDGTLGEYMHLAPSGDRGHARPARRARPGARAVGQHRVLVDAAPALPGHDRRRRRRVGAQSFPFQLAVAPNRVEEPVQGRRYAAWETRGESR